MHASWLTALAVSAQLVAPALPLATAVPLAESPRVSVADATPPAPAPRLSLRDAALLHTLAPAAGHTMSQQAGSPPSKRGKILTGALIGFAVGSVLGVTVGQESCLDQSKWVCVAKGGGTGAAVGLLIAAWK